MMTRKPFAASIGRSFLDATFQLLEPTCPLLGHNPFNVGSTNNDTKISGDIESILLYTLCHHQFVSLLVKMSIKNIS